MTGQRQVRTALYSRSKKMKYVQVDLNRTCCLAVSSSTWTEWCWVSKECLLYSYNRNGWSPLHDGCRLWDTNWCYRAGSQCGTLVKRLFDKSKSSFSTEKAVTTACNPDELLVCLFVPWHSCTTSPFYALKRGKRFGRGIYSFYTFLVSTGWGNNLAEIYWSQ